MNIWNIVIGSAVALLFALALRSVIRGKGSCGCSGNENCEICGRCQGRAEKDE